MKRLPTVYETIFTDDGYHPRDAHYREGFLPYEYDGHRFYARRCQIILRPWVKGSMLTLTVMDESSTRQSKVIFIKDYYDNPLSKEQFHFPHHLRQLLQALHMGDIRGDYGEGVANTLFHYIILNDTEVSPLVPGPFLASLRNAASIQQLKEQGIKT